MPAEGPHPTWRAHEGNQPSHSRRILQRTREGQLRARIVESFPQRKSGSGSGKDQKGHPRG
jgi:hypothetical protein